MMTLTPPENSKLFTKWKDPVSGIESLVLTQRVAPGQQSFYFTQPSFCADGRFLWFDCFFPPGKAKMLGVVDFLTQDMFFYPETEHQSRPYVDQVTGEVYWGIGLEIWKRGPLPADKPVLINQFPRELAGNRIPQHIANHLTLSVDKKSFAIDASFPREIIIGDLPLDGSQFNLWTTSEQYYNHGQFSPTDPDVILLPQDSSPDPVTGEMRPGFDRLWLAHRNGELKQLLPDNPLPPANRGHEWWDVDGEHVWFIDYTEGPDQGTKRVNIHTGKVEQVWTHGHSHSHCDATGNFFVGDIVSWPNDKWEVAFFNRKTQKEISIVRLLPPSQLRSRYHGHPHPQFCLNDQYICYTTSVFGKIDIALVPVKNLIEMTQ
ncbi:MAG: hypothetical protein PF904_01385 [Kiritimatiellae bacterium]|jgi:hypothetical protein|nr:hypothetical protein [Kiritimatiellia bacterium]